MRDRIVLPPYAPGMRIGLFGGTFDPAHAAHRAACLLALHRLGLDRVWWLVTPGNPLKDTKGLAPLAKRVAAARALAHHPRIDVTDLEAELGTAYTYETISYLRPALSRRAFRLDHGRRQSAQLPSLAALARHRPTGADRGRRSAGTEPLCDGQRRRRRRWRVSAFPKRRQGRLRNDKPPAWIYLHGLKSPLSSTALRAARALTPLNDSCLTAKQLNPLTRRAYLKASPGFGGRGTSGNWSERISTPVHSCNLSGRTSRARSGLQNAS